MAVQAVRAFCGETIVHVGEWRGDTGDHHFESELAANWELQTRLPLPNWGDTAEDLTVWKRRKARLLLQLLSSNRRSIPS